MSDPNSPFDIPVTPDFGPVERVVIQVTVTRGGVELPRPEAVQVVIKGCLKGNLKFKCFAIIYPLFKN